MRKVGEVFGFFYFPHRRIREFHSLPYLPPSGEFSRKFSSGTEVILKKILKRNNVRNSQLKVIAGYDMYIGIILYLL